MKMLHKILMLKFLITFLFFVTSLVLFWYSHFFLGLLCNLLAYIIRNNIKVQENENRIYILHLSTKKGHIYLKTKDFDVLNKIILENTDLNHISLIYNNFSLYLQDFDRHILVSNLDKFKILTNG